MSTLSVEQENWIICEHHNGVGISQIRRNFRKEFGFSRHYLSLKNSHFQHIIKTFKKNGVSLRKRMKPEKRGRRKKSLNDPKYVQIMEIFTKNHSASTLDVSFCFH